MQVPAGGAAILDQAGASLDRAIALLLDPKPDTLDLCEQPLREAADAMKRYCESTGQAAADGALLIRDKLARVKALLQHAQAFHQGWIQTITGGAAGYRADGASDLGATGPTRSIDC